ncbi:hypothetical protein [Paraburkholderia gardini]|uniref:hypothetical protein n=1 Tax=Paraburkholderia gardini TaxID=2823469 RepID=UPI001E430A5D|nr:hypothetical protein [Paraburkholderia gardini]
MADIDVVDVEMATPNLVRDLVGRVPNCALVKFGKLFANTRLNGSEVVSLQN